MAKTANLENQQINRVLGIWYNGEFGKFRKSTDQQRSIQKFLRMENLQSRNINRSTEFWVFGIMANLANFENQQIEKDFWYPFKKF